MKEETIKPSSVENVLHSGLYSVNEKSTAERHRSLLHANDRILTGVSTEDIVNHLTEPRRTAKERYEKIRYTRDIKFVKSLIENDTA